MFDPAEHQSAFTLIPVGPHPATITAIEFKRSKAGKPMIVMTHSLVNHEKEILDYFVLQDNCLWRLSALCGAIGHAKPFDERNKAQVDSVFMGKRFNLIIEHEDREYEGKTQAWEKAGGYEPLAGGSGDGDPFSDDSPPSDPFGAAPHPAAGNAHDSFSQDDIPF